ncbi:MAG TPA: arsenite methyltransferase [Actinomycetota bacterium]|nr:arsenite methyltransferase [Actinomycetota bacterium]
MNIDLLPEPPEDKTVEEPEIREAVRARYTELAVLASAGSVSCCGEGGDCCFGTTGYDSSELMQIPELAANASLGCGNPTAVAGLGEGEVVLDLGSGGGIDVLLSARRVGPAGKAYGLDMTDEMLELSRRNAEEAGISNVEFVKGHIEDIPLPDESVDVVISNCVINLSADKAQVLREAARVLRPGGRFAVSDVIADEDMDDETRQSMQSWTGCVAGALTRSQYIDLLAAAGLEDIEVTETHRVHEAAGSAIVRARKPS